MEQKPFWETKALHEMSSVEWESLCDGCGKCCLVKLRDEDSGALSFTDIACRLLDTQSCRCTNYAERTKIVSDCVALSADNLAALDFMPASCAYRRLQEGRGLAAWHPLISGTAARVEQAGMSVAGRAVSELQITDDWEDHIVDWPCADAD